MVKLDVLKFYLVLLILRLGQSLPSHCSRIAMLCQRRPEMTNSPTIAPTGWREQ